MDYQNNKSRGHILNSTFGMGKYSKDLDFWNFVYDKTVSSGYARKVILSELYDEYYNIHQHNDLSRPLSQVALHEGEKFDEYSLEYRKLKEFASVQIGKYFNISFSEYIELPISVHQHMVKIATDIMKKNSNTIETFKQELEDS